MNDNPRKIISRLWGVVITRTVGIGHQSFERLITKSLFYIDKTNFIKEWWENEKYRDMQGI